MNTTRRHFFQKSLIVASLPLAASSLPALAAESISHPKLKVVCVGGHPDDPESGCAGTLSRYAAEGHDVKIIYLTRGERGIRDKGLDESAKIRTAESEKACSVMGARAYFFGQIDGATEFTRAHVDAMTSLLSTQSPDVLFTHWPIDTHMDHQVASLLTIRAAMNLKKRPHLYFFEVNSGSQSQGFCPDSYVDISAFLEKKKQALFTHVSQDGQGVWRDHHEIISAWRGREAGVKAAEAFVHYNRDSQISNLPGV